MAVRVETIKGLGQIVRLYDCAEPGERGQFCAVCVLEWADPRTLWVKGLHGRLTRLMMRELVQLIVTLGASMVLAYRTEGKGLPCGVLGDDGVVRVMVADLVERFTRDGASGAADF